MLKKKKKKGNENGSDEEDVAVEGKQTISPKLLFLHKNVCCRYALELPRRGLLISTHNF